ncbi:MAG: proline--tRNA ligase [Rickettsiales bacterium]|nr:proline--tRNA ligase [Rickettsiales bacterium]
MKLSQYFIPLLKEEPLEAKIASHRLMLRSGLIRQQNSGLYIWLPMGLKVLKKIEKIVRDGMNKFGAIEILMPCVQPAKLWQDSGRYNDYGQEMLRFKDRHENDLLFGPTNEEVVTEIVKNNIKSYKELPKNFYHIQWKFRDEIRPRFGLLRGREFLMKDAYSFDVDEARAIRSYDNMFKSYIEIFKNLSLNAIPVRATTGAIGGNLSHEFHILAKTGESDIFYDQEIEKEIAAPSPDITKLKNMYAVADDMFQADTCPIAQDALKKYKSIEVGHIFCFGTKYTTALDCKIMDEQGKLIQPYCGSYGIGISRLAAAIIEASHDEKGIIWPKSVTPFHVSLVNVGTKDENCIKTCDALYAHLENMGIDVLYDDTQNSPGQKFSSHDLMGIPLQIIIGPRALAKQKVELKIRANNTSTEIDIDNIVTLIKEHYTA